MKKESLSVSQSVSQSLEKTKIFPFAFLSLAQKLKMRTHKKKTLEKAASKAQFAQKEIQTQLSLFGQGKVVMSIGLIGYCVCHV